jgi:hypothetical protein
MAYLSPQCHPCNRAKEGAEEEHRHLLRIPRRPLWDKFTTAEELQQREREGSVHLAGCRV